MQARPTNREYKNPSQVRICAIGNSGRRHLSLLSTRCHAYNASILGAYFQVGGTRRCSRKIAQTRSNRGFIGNAAFLRRTLIRNVRYGSASRIHRDVDCFSSMGLEKNLKSTMSRVDLL